MLMALCGVRVVAPRPPVEGDFTNLAERVQLMEGVVDCGAANLGQTRERTLKNLIGGEVHVRSPQRLYDHPPLRRQAQAAPPQAPQQ